MNCLGCNGAWFVEERQIIAPREPSADGHAAPASRVRYIYTCASCGLPFGEKPKRAKASPKPTKKRAA